MGKNVRIERGKSDGASRVAGENPSLAKRGKRGKEMALFRPTGVSTGI
jgi:hypothetical protein